MNLSTINKNIELADIQEEIKMIPAEYLSNLYELIHIFRKNIIPETAQVHTPRIENYINTFIKAFESILSEKNQIHVNYFIQENQAVWLECNFIIENNNKAPNIYQELMILDTNSILEQNNYTKEYFLGQLIEKQKVCLFLPKEEKIYLVKLPQNHYWANLQAKNDVRGLLGIFLEYITGTK